MASRLIEFQSLAGTVIVRIVFGLVIVLTSGREATKLLESLLFMSIYKMPRALHSFKFERDFASAKTCQLHESNTAV